MILEFDHRDGPRRRRLVEQMKRACVAANARSRRAAFAPYNARAVDARSLVRLRSSSSRRAAWICAVSAPAVGAHRKSITAPFSSTSAFEYRRLCGGRTCPIRGAVGWADAALGAVDAIPCVGADQADHSRRLAFAGAVRPSRRPPHRPPPHSTLRHRARAIGLGMPLASRRLAQLTASARSTAP